MKEARWYESGAEPDYRFSLANERTFLAWVRTALAILAGALVLHQLTVDLRLLRLPISAGGCLALLSGVLAAVAYRRWKANEIAMRHGWPLPRSRFIAVFAIVAAALAVVAAMTMFARW